jgi:hypothetical protein
MHGLVFAWHGSFGVLSGTAHEVLTGWPTLHLHLQKFLFSLSPIRTSLVFSLSLSYSRYNLLSNSVSSKRARQMAFLFFWALDAWEEFRTIPLFLILLEKVFVVACLQGPKEPGRYVCNRIGEGGLYIIQYEYTHIHAIITTLNYNFT